MTVLPIVDRELRVAARRPSTYWIRTGAALAMVSLGAWILLTFWRESPQEISKVLFGLLSGTVMFYCLLSGLRYTSDCLSQEKRDGTLGLLFLTDLKGHDVVLGKLAATSLNAFYAALSVVPIQAVPLLLGGVTPGEVARASLVSVNTLFLSLSFGLCASAFCKSARTAGLVTFLALLILAAVFPAIGLLFNILNKPPAQVLAWSLPSPGFGFAMAFDALFTGRSRLYWGSLLLNHLLGWIALALASFVLPRTWQDRASSAFSWKERLRLWTLGQTRARSAHRQRLLNVNPFFWLASRVRSKTLVPWLFLAVTAAVWVGFYIKFRGNWLNQGVYISTALILGLAFKAWIASEATRQMAEERHGGTLELLLSTPLSVQEILTGQWLALCRQFLWPVCAVVMILVALMQATINETTQGQRAEIATLWLGGILMFLADLVTLYWVGMWDGLTTANAQRAAGNSLAKVLLVPWGAMAILVVGISVSASRGGRGPEPMFIFYAWLSFGLVTNLVYTAWARTKLLTQFRVIAARKYTPPLNVWQKVGRLLSRDPLAPPGAHH